MYLLTTDQMKEVERVAIEDMGVPSLILMENAAKNAAAEVLKLSPESVAVFAGKGNNGGDGLAIARHLVTNGVDVKVYFVGDKNRATTDCKKNLEILENYDINVIYGVEDCYLDDCDVIVDALIGTGLKRKLSNEYEQIVDIINSSGCKIVSVDCPTGINSDTGDDYGLAVNADITVTFHMAKIGLYLYPAYAHVGKIVVADIGIPYVNISDTIIIDDIKMPKRNPYSHKGTYGKVLIVAGSDTMAGAAVMNCRAAYSVGAGLVNLCSTEHVIDVIHNSVPEAVTTNRSEIDYNYGNVCLIGSGLGKNYELVKNVIENYKGKIVIDADGLNSISGNTDILFKRNNECIITPHIMEMSRLTGYDKEFISSNMIDVAKEFAAKYNIIVVLKDAHTVITDGKNVYINITGTPAMSKGGTGDCLCGIIAGLIAQFGDSLKSAAIGCYICGKAGEIAESKLGAYSVLASDIIDNIADVIK